MAGLAAPALANAPLTSLRPLPRPGGPRPVRSEADILKSAALSGTTAYIVTRRNGQVLAAQNATTALPPASVAKAVTALYAMEALGGGYQFSTALLGTGPIANGVLDGDLILQGTGDPTLDTDALGALASDLKAAGVTRITGKFYVDGRALPAVEEIDASQPPQAGYNPAISGLNLNYNRVHFEWRKTGSDYRLTMDARATKFQPRVALSAMRIVPEPYPVYTFSKRADREQWTVARTALGNGGARWLPVRSPDAYAGEVFRTLAAHFGVTLPAAQAARGKPRGVVLARLASPGLQGLCGSMLKWSTNLTAEVLGLRATQARGGSPRSLTASAAAMNAWARDRYDAPLKLVDHSGLGHASRVTGKALVSLLNGTSALEPMLKSITVRDAKGAPVKTPRHVIRAKTGTLNFVSSLAGYVTPRGGERLTFAIISSDLPRRAAAVKQGDERPSGSKSFARRARAMQQALIAGWAEAAVDA
ncbi:MAG: D-alanyl-D-alanine carboxypeptidase/D-alanyl-D-alanine-endopeptidase [Pseudomonadota bacterium]